MALLSGLINANPGIAKLVGQAKMAAMQKKLRGGPQSMLPGAPVKGSGIPNSSGLTPAAPRQYVVPQQNPTPQAVPGKGLLGRARLGISTVPADPMNQSAHARKPQAINRNKPGDSGSGAMWSRNRTQKG